MVAVAAILVCVLIVILVTLYVFNPTRRKINKIIGPPTLPVIGNAHQFKPNGSDFYEQCMEFYQQFNDNGMLRIWLGIKPVVLLFRSHTVESLLNSTKHIQKSAQYHFLHPWLRTGLLTSTGDKWKHRRRLLTPTFHFRILADFVDVFNEQSDVLVARLHDDMKPEGFDIFPYITACALDIICETAMGRTVNAQYDHESEYVSAIYKISELIHLRQKRPWLWPDFLYNTIFSGKEHDRCVSVLHDFTEKVIRERTIEFEERFGKTQTKTLEDFIEDEGTYSQKKRLVFLDMLIHASEGETKLSFTDIQEEVDTFMFEGHDTTAAGIAWATFLIGSHPEVQKKLHQEMDDIFGRSNNRHATVDDIKKMKYLEIVIKEALRLYPSVPFFARTLTEDLTVDGRVIPKGVDAIIFTNALHRDPTIFPDPEKFCPERFNLENASGRHAYSYVPFSAGMRNCIGQRFAMMEEKVVLSSLFRNFNVTSLATSIRPVCELILRPETGIRVRLTPRD